MILIRTPRQVADRCGLLAMTGKAFAVWVGCVSLVLSFFMVVSAKAGSVALEPYRAVYEITLEDGGRRLAQPAALKALSGRMVYELTGSSCEGYSMTQRLVTASDMIEGGRIFEDMQIAGFEDPSGDTFEFVSRRLIGNQLNQKQRGVAKQTQIETELTMREPNQEILILPHKVHFPIGFLQALIAAAQGGERLFSAYLFDGAEKVGAYYHTTSTIGSVRAARRNQGALSRVGKKKSWPLTIAYFQATDQSENMTPLYELSTTLFENGVSGSLQLDFGDYVMRASLKSIEMLPSASCP